MANRLVESDLPILKELLEYEDGHLRFKDREQHWFESYRAFCQWNARCAGKVAGTQRPDGRILIGLFSKQYYAHQIIFLMFHGYLPEMVDHKDNNPSNNVISNLRAATALTNSFNQRKPKNNTSGAKGVRLVKSSGKWRATITVEGKKIHLGYFETMEDAANAYATASKEKHKEFGRTE